MSPPGTVGRDAVELTVYVAEPHVKDRHSKVDQLFRAAALSGASRGTVLSAYEGFGRRHLHEPTFWHHPDETPLMVVFVDTRARVEQILALVGEILPDSVAIIEPVYATQFVRQHSDEV